MTSHWRRSQPEWMSPNSWTTWTGDGFAVRRFIFSEHAQCEGVLCHRVLELCESARYGDTVLLTAAVPRGVLRNVHTVELFRGEAHTRFIYMESQMTYGEMTFQSKAGNIILSPCRCEAPPPRSVPPLLLFFQALLTSVPPGEADLLRGAGRCPE